MSKFSRVKLLLTLAGISSIVLVIYIVLQEIGSSDCLGKRLEKNRTEHAYASESNKKNKANRLINSISPYLLQHAYNPVDWHPWGEEAFDKARRENKLLLLSIGYSTCYWCHVMERETFEDKDIASFLNEHIVSVKIDREQHPDVDEIYMTATQMLTRSGGWPNNVFVTPDLKPFFAGTYFPPVDSGGRHGFKTVVSQLSDQWRDNPARVKEIASKLSSAIVEIKSRELSSAMEKLPKNSLVETLRNHLFNYYDPLAGGFYQAPKFPQESSILFLLNSFDITSNYKEFDVAQSSLLRMAEGGIHDHVGGGFHRYTTDRHWRVPHFEKMLYNQALLGRAYTELFSITKMEGDKTTAEGIFDFVLRKMTHPDGAFYSALDAETDATEGAYYVWTQDELQNVINRDELHWLNKTFLFAEIPKIQGHKHPNGQVLYLRHQEAQSSLNDSMPYEQKIHKQKRVMKILRGARDKRKLPHLDDKIISSWNGLMIDAFSRASIALSNDDYLNAATRAADFILKNMRKPDGSLYRIWRDSRRETSALFDDYAYMIQGLVSLYHASNNIRFLKAAKELLKIADSLYLDHANGGYFFSVEDEHLLVRTKHATDSAIPSANSVIAHTFLDLYHYTSDPKWLNRATSTIKAFPGVNDNPASYPHLVHALMRYQTISTTVEKSAKITLEDKFSPATTLDINALSSNSVLSPRLISFKTNKNNFRLVLSLKVADGWHINTEKPSLEFLVPTSLEVRDDNNNLIVNKSKYPDNIHLVKTALGEIKTWSQEALISLTGSIKGELSNPRVVLTSQACSEEGQCLLPSDWVLGIDDHLRVPDL